MSQRQQLDALLNDYRRQVLRWNKQINLVSRLDTEERLQGLIHQCRSCWDRLAAPSATDLATARALWYFDLGSGGGLPGFIWHAQAIAAGQQIRTWLVEPREKRAWFLNRLNNLNVARSITVMENHWDGLTGEDFGLEAGADFPSHILVSLKALHLTDAEVLEGLAPLLIHTGRVPEGIKIQIARFYPPKQPWNTTLAANLGIPASGEDRSCGGQKFQALGGGVLKSVSLQGAGLVMSGYLTQSP